MSGRQLAGLVLLGAAAWAVFRRSATNLPPDPLHPPTALPGAPATPSTYDAATIARESGGNAGAKNPRSTASGLYQFTRATWLSVGGQWGPDLSKPFGGLNPSVAEQTARFEKLTAANAAGLVRSGIAATNATLYAAHFLGLSRAVKVLAAAPSTLLANLLPSAVISANPQLRGFSVADFRQWLQVKR